MILMCLLVLLNLIHFALVIFYCFTLNFPLSKEVFVSTDYLILSLPSIKKPDSVIVSAVVINTLAIDELAELLGQLKTPDLSILLIPKQWFEGCKIIVWVSNLSSKMFFGETVSESFFQIYDKT